MTDPSGKDKVSFTISKLRMTFTRDDLLAICSGAGMHVVTEADKAVLDAMSKVKIKYCLGVPMISDAKEADLCRAELARRKVSL